MSTEFKPPESLATCADLLYTTRQHRLELEKQVDALKSTETLLREHLIARLPSDGSTGVAGQVARVSIIKKVEPQVQDWDNFLKYVAKNKAWDMLQRRINPAAIKARWENGKTVTGIGEFLNVTLSLNKVK